MFGGIVLQLLDEDENLSTLDSSVIYECAKNFAQRNGIVFDGGLTGFMVGWGVNAARYAKGKPIGPNPAIMEL